MTAMGRYTPGRSSYSGASSDKPDQEERPDCADTQNRPASEAVVRLYVLFFILIVVEVVEDPGPEEKVREGAVPDAVVGAVVVGLLGLATPCGRPLSPALLTELPLPDEDLLGAEGFPPPPPPRPPPPLCASAALESTIATSNARVTASATTVMGLARLSFNLIIRSTLRARLVEASLYALQFPEYNPVRLR